jgi:hypothetical protein
MVRPKWDTILPILDGGFDPQQLALGVVHRFDFRKEGSNRYR